MARSRKVLLAASALFAAAYLKKVAFVPAALRSHAAPVAAASAIALGAPAAFADEIGDAAKKLAAESYAFAREVDWNNGIYLQAPGAFQPSEALRAIDKMILLGAQADPKLLKAAALAHHKAIGSISGANGVTSQADWEAVNAALGRVFASVSEQTVMDVYDSVSLITDPGVPAYLKSLVNSGSAEKAYAAFLNFKDVVKKNQVSKSGGEAGYGQAGDSIDVAAKKLSAASYPFLREVDWKSDLYMKPFPGASQKDVLAAVDKSIVMGLSMNGNALQAAACAHHRAIGSIDSNGVTSQDAYADVNAAVGRLISTVPTTKVMDVYNAFAKIVPGQVTNYLFSQVNPLDAQAAAKAFYEFKDVVKAAQQYRPIA
jgi:hypothetical protein